MLTATAKRTAKNFNHCPHFVRLHRRSSTATQHLRMPAFGITSRGAAEAQRRGHRTPLLKHKEHIELLEIGRA